MFSDFQAALDALPVSVACARVRDARIVVANERFLRTFQLRREDIGTISAYDVIAPVHEDIFRNDHDGDHGRQIGDEAEQFRVFKRRDDSTFIGWSRNVMIDLPDGERAAMSVVFEYYDEETDDNLVAAFYSFQAATARKQLARHVAQELNSSLHQIGLVLSDPAIPDHVRERVQKALVRTDMLGERLVRVGLLDEETEEAILAAHQRLSDRPQDVHLPAGSGCKVLIVDDDEDLAHLLSVALVRDGCHVEVAHDAKSARAILRSFAPKYVLLDLVLGNDDGRVLARELTEQMPDVPIVFMTAFAHAAALAEASSQHHLLRKPFELAELRAILAKVVAA